MIKARYLTLLLSNFPLTSHFSKNLIELAFLGAPWAEYARTAELLELVVIRIPMVEGFAPSSPGELDFILNKIVKHHTLRGENVLAHCRGGIGRAG